jgi:hypothetical protein
MPVLRLLLKLSSRTAYFQNRNGITSASVRGILRGGEERIFSREFLFFQKIVSAFSDMCRGRVDRLMQNNPVDDGFDPLPPNSGGELNKK